MVQLLVAQGDNWIDLHGAACWNLASGECDNGQDNGYDGEG
jgi:hypothetical protein